MKTTITATAPTAYQLNSLRAFHLEVKEGHGSFTGTKEFSTIKEAREYLKDLAFDYYDGDKNQIKRHLGKNSLTLDAVTAFIVK